MVVFLLMISRMALFICLRFVGVDGVVGCGYVGRVDQECPPEESLDQVEQQIASYTLQLENIADNPQVGARQPLQVACCEFANEWLVRVNERGGAEGGRLWGGKNSWILELKIDSSRSLTHSFTHSLTHSFTHSPTHSPTS